LAKALQIKWEETLLAEAKEKAAAEAAAKAAAEAKRKAAEEAARKANKPIKCPEYSYNLAAGQTQENPNAEKCSGTKCQDYRGFQTMTKGGKTCMRWTEQKPHKHELGPNEKPGSGTEVGNYCRNPGGKSDTIWCYTTDKNTRWQYCEPLKDIEKCTGKRCAGYRGKQSQTRSGRTCMDWKQQRPHRHKKITLERYPSSGLEMGNVCRNPNNAKTTWCFTTDRNKRWEYCDPIRSAGDAFFEKKKGRCRRANGTRLRRDQYDGGR
jgi:integrin beta 3